MKELPVPIAVPKSLYVHVLLAISVAILVAACGGGNGTAHSDSGGARPPRLPQVGQVVPPIGIHYVAATACASFSSPAVPKATSNVSLLTWTLSRPNQYGSFDGYPSIPAAWTIGYNPAQTTYPTPSNLVGTIPCGTPAGIYEGYGQWTAVEGPSGPAIVRITVTSAPTPTPGPVVTCAPYLEACTAPPPPSIPKLVYTASLSSKPTLNFADSADATQGSLTWHVTGDTALFKNLRFTVATTAAPPHANPLLFEVPDTVPPADYAIHVSVTASSSGLTSSETIVTLRVLPPVTYESEINGIGLYEEDSQGNIIVSDGSRVVTDDDGKVPDFPVDTGPMDTLGASRSPRAVDGGFNAFAPPDAVASRLKQIQQNQRFTCAAYLAEGNAVNDMAAGTQDAQGNIRVVVYCQNFSGFPAVSVWWTGWNLNRPSENATNVGKGLPCAPAGNYSTFHVCETERLPVTPAFGHAERTIFRADVAYLSATKFSGKTAANGTFYMNDKGVFYPKVQILPSWAIRSVYQQGNGYVKFPADKVFKYCFPGRRQPCHGFDRDQLGINLLNPKLGGLPAPPAGFQPHHIAPISWCGDNDVTNGVFLPQRVADDSQDYTPNTHSAFTAWWSLPNFTPAQPRPDC